MSATPLDRLAANPAEARLLADRGEEILGYAIATLLNTFSRRKTRQRLESFGLSPATSAALLRHLEEDPANRRDLARRLLGRAKTAAVICLVASVLAFVPGMPWIYVGAIAAGAVYGVWSLVPWKRYARPIAR